MQMGNALPIKKLDRKNFNLWKYTYGYNSLSNTDIIWESWWIQEVLTMSDATNWVKYFLVSCMHNHMLHYIKYMKTTKEAQTNLSFQVSSSTRIEWHWIEEYGYQWLHYKIQTLAMTKTGSLWGDGPHMPPKIYNSNSAHSKPPSIIMRDTLPMFSNLCMRTHMFGYVQSWR